MVKNAMGAAAGLDVRLRGFTDRAPLSAGWAWLDAQPEPAGPELTPLARAAGRVLADAVTTPASVPGPARAASDGYAVRAADCDGASAYNPLMLAWMAPGGALLPPGAACPIAAGWTLPAGAEAVLPFEAAERIGADWLAVMAAVAVGAGVDRRAPGLPGTVVLPPRRRLRPAELAGLAVLGVTTVAVRPRPRVRLIVPGAKYGADVLTPLLTSLLVRDGAAVEPVVPGGPSEAQLAAALSPGWSGVTLIAGRSGAGPDDAAAAAVQARGGRLDLHGFALQPGGSAGLGTMRGQPAILLPGEPYACLAAYDLLAARLVRRVGGVAAWPYEAVTLTLDRKIASSIGLTELVPVRVAGGRAQPVSSEPGGGALLADGFVLVPEASEGHASGASVRVHLYDQADRGSDIPLP